MYRIKTIKAKGCRGILADSDLNVSSGGLLLGGDNGVGKSSFVDVIEKVLTGKCSTVETGDQTISWPKHGKHILADEPPEIAVVLTDGNQEWTIRPDSDLTKLPGSLRDMLAAAKQESFVLRRRRLLKFVDAKPVDRYTALESFFNFNRFTSVEAAIKQALQFVTQDSQAASVSLQVATKRLQASLKIPETAKLTVEAAVSAINALATEASVVGILAVDECEKKLSEVSERLKPFAGIERLGRLELAEHHLNQIIFQSSITALESLHSAQAAAEAEEARLKGHFYASVLQDALAWVDEDHLTNCPVCEAPINRDELERSVSRRLEQNAVLTKLRDVEQQAREEVEAALASVAQSALALCNIWKSATEQDPPKDIAAAAEDLTVLGRRFRARGTLQQIETTKATIQSSVLRTGLVGLAAELSNQKAKFPTADQYSRLKALEFALTALRDQRPAIHSLRVKSERLANQATHLRRLQELAEKSRKDTVQAIVADISDLARSYFGAIHDGDGIGDPKLVVPSRGSGSLSLESNFHGETSDPRGLFSEGHLDSLGLCLFLALRRLHHAANKNLSILVLDDVLHSVDGEHRLATAKLIFEQFKDHQIIITTHDKLWLDYLKQITKKHAPGKEFSTFFISRWSILGGPVWGDHRNDREWLVSVDGLAASVPNRAGAAGRLLEETLQNLCENLGVSVPYRRRGDHTIDPLWTNFQAAAKKNKQFAQAAARFLDAIEDLRSIRNTIGAHWNQWALGLSAKEADRFVEAVLGLREVAFCEDCGEFIKRVQLDGVWACTGEHLRYDKLSASQTVAGKT